MVTNNIVQVERMLQHGADPDQTWPDGMTGLHVSAQFGYLQMAAVLVGAGADINAIDLLGQTPLFHAVVTNNIKLVRFLLDKNANTGISNNIGYSPLHVSAYYNYETSLDLLCKKMVDLDIRTDKGYTALHIASSQGHSELVQKLLASNRVDINSVTQDGSTSLSLASKAGSLATVTTLIKQGADVNKTNSAGVSPLHEGCLANHPDIVQKLLSSGARSLVYTKDGQLPSGLGTSQACKELVHKWLFIDEKVKKEVLGITPKKEAKQEVKQEEEQEVKQEVKQEVQFKGPYLK